MTAKFDWQGTPTIKYLLMNGILLRSSSVGQNAFTLKFPSILQVSGRTDFLDVDLKKSLKIIGRIPPDQVIIKAGPPVWLI